MESKLIKVVLNGDVIIAVVLYNEKYGNTIVVKNKSINLEYPLEIFERNEDNGYFGRSKDVSIIDFITEILSEDKVNI